jgi:hypothetical protein
MTSSPRGVSTPPKEVITEIAFTAKYIAIDFDIVAAGRTGWWYRPFSEAELDAHPDCERIRATVRAAIDDIIDQACAEAKAVFAAGDGAGE